MLKIYDQNHTYLGNIVQVKDYKIESQTASGDKTLSCTVLDASVDLKTEYYLRNESDEYVIKEVNRTTAGFPAIVGALNLEELEGKAWKTFQATNSTISAAAQLAIAGTGWTVASSDVMKTRNAGILKKSALGVLNDLCTAFMCEISYDTINKTISFHTQKGQDRGVYFLAGLNLKKLTTKSGTYDFYTRLIPYGAEDLDIKSVNGGKEYVENYQYSDKIRTYIWVDTNYTDATALKTDAIAKLADMSKPAVSYSADVYDLAAMSDTYDLLSYGVGDTITLIDESTGTKDRQRIVKLTEYPEEPERNTCELSNTALTWEEMQSKLQSAAQIIDTVISSDGQYNGTISVSDILHFEDGVVDTTTGTSLASFFETTSGAIGVLQLDVGDLKANALTAETADLRYATIANLNAATARISTLESTAITAEYANLHYATIDSLSAAVGRIATLESTAITAEYADLHYADIDLSNVAAQSVTTAMIQQGAIGTAQIADGSITSAKIVNLDASKITTGTLDASNLNVINLNAASITVGTINGQQLANGIIDLTKLSSEVTDEMDATREMAENTLVYDNSYTIANDIASFTAYLYQGGVDIKNSYSSELFVWYLKTEEGISYLGSGYTMDVSIADCGYGAEVIGRFNQTDNSQALNEDGDNYTSTDGTNITVNATGESVRIRDLTVSTRIFDAEKLLVIGTEDEHLVTMDTYYQYLKARLNLPETLQTDDYHTDPAEFVYPTSVTYPAVTIYPSNGVAVTTGLLIDLVNHEIRGSVPDYYNQIVSLQEEALRLANELNAAQDDISDLQSDLAGTQGDVSSIQSAISLMQIDISTLQTAVSTNTSNIETLQNNYSALDNRITALENALVYPKESA